MGVLAPLLLGVDDIGGSAGPASGGVVNVTVVPASVSLVVGGATVLSARAFDLAGTEQFGGTVTWSSANEAIAIVSATGTVVGIAAGSVVISATVDGVVGVTLVSVTPVPAQAQTGWEPADLVVRCRRLAGRPATDAGTSDEDWYAYLTDAESHWVQQLAVHAPEVLYGPPEKMFTLDGGHTYHVSTFPLGRMEVRESPSGPLMYATAEFTPGRGDFVWEGASIRFPNGVARQFSNGPWARYVPAPGEITPTSGSRLPVVARRLLVYHALVLWASRGNYRDPGTFETLERKAWSGDPNFPGDVGVLGAIKTQLLGAGVVAGQGLEIPWYKSPDLGGF